MDYLPIFIDLRGGCALVVGGGEEAARKLRLLARTAAAITVVAADPCAEIAALAAAGRITLERRAFAPGDLSGMTVAFAADAACGDAVAAAATAAGVPVNVVDRPERSTFIMPAIVDRDPVVVAIGSAGTAPVLARRLRAQIEALLPARLGALARFAGRFRGGVQALHAGAVERRRFWERFLDGPVAAQVLAGDEGRAAEAMLPILNRAAPAPAGVVHLVGTGPGDPDLLTVRALRAMDEADVVLHDAAPPAILERVRRDALRRSTTGLDRAQTVDAIAAEARQGRRVLVLLPGAGNADAAEALRRQGLAVVTVPGVGSAPAARLFPQRTAAG